MAPSHLDGRFAGEDLHRGLEAALRSGGPEVNRLSRARSSVSFRLADDTGAVTLLLDRRPPQLSTDAGVPGEIEIELSRSQAQAFVCGALSMSAAVASGNVEADGPVRKYLEIDPILRRLLAAANRGADVDGSNGHAAYAIPDQANPELLSIETRDLCKAFGPHDVLTGASITIPAGMISCVVGPSGTGKSVLLKHLIGLMEPDAGEILIRGRPLSRMTRGELIALRRDVGVMFQDGALFSAMSLYDNVAFPLRQHSDLEEHEIREIVNERLATVGLLDAADRLPAQLSGGMKKRAGLARALVLDPSVLLCDEPDSGLDPVRTSLLADLLIEEHERIGGTVLVITHNIALAKHIGDHVSVLWRGKVVESGTFDQLASSGTEFVQQFLKGSEQGPLGMD